MMSDMDYRKTERFNYANHNDYGGCDQFTPTLGGSIMK